MGFLTGITGPSIPFQYTYFAIAELGFIILTFIFFVFSPRGLAALRRCGGWVGQRCCPHTMERLILTRERVDSRLDASRNKPGASDVSRSDCMRRLPRRLSRLALWCALGCFTVFLLLFPVHDLIHWAVGWWLAWLWLLFGYTEFILSVRPSIASQLAAAAAATTSGSPDRCATGCMRLGVRTPAVLSAVAKNRHLLREMDAMFAFSSCLLVFLLSFFLRGICVSPQPVHFSFYYFRNQNHHASICPLNQAKPCHVYLTLAADLRTSVLLNYHTTTPEPGATVARVRQVYPVNGSEVEYTGSATRYRIEVDRWAHTVLLSGLSPDTVYSVSAGEALTAAAPITFRTAPADPNAEVSFIEGGDAGNTPEAMEMSRLAAAAYPPPLFAVIGGDVAYENNFPTCYRLWDKWLADWERLMVTSEGHAIPMNVLVGNHESSQEAWGDSLDPSKVTSYFHLFAQEEGAAVADVTARRSYHLHMIGPAVALISLDSRHVVTYETQVPWVESLMAPGQPAAQAAVKLFTFHMPLFSEVDKQFCTYGEVGSYYARARDAWAPLFERMNATAAFQHHEHTFSRTKPLWRAGRAVADPTQGEEGVVYLGGGAWGDAIEYSVTCSKKQQEKDARVGPYGWFFEKVSYDFNVWHGVVRPSAAATASHELSLRAFGLSNQTLDNLVLLSKGVSA